jgi:hypothetical protein
MQLMSNVRPLLMRVDHFLATVYLGDRACKAVLIDSWKDRVSIVVDEISRIRSESGLWEFYNDENVTNGTLVFGGVRFCSLTPPGPLPSDQIDIESIESVDTTSEHFRVRFHIMGWFPETKEMCSMQLEIIANSVHIEDPEKPGVKIER